MRDFTCYNPTRIEFGKEKEKQIGNYISEFGIKKILIVYGSQRIKKDGLFDIVQKSLEEACAAEFFALNECVKPWETYGNVNEVVKKFINKKY